jgi:rSAM/selenodomain-associated transferase 1
MKSEDALIVFAKMPLAGAVKTRLGKSLGMEKAATLYKEFAEHAFDLARACAADGIAVYVFYAPGTGAAEIARWVGLSSCMYAEQEGESLGDRMRSAFQYTFHRGARRTVIIGTDVPELELTVLRNAFGLLVDHQVVIGPSPDAGYYLLGMQTPLKELFWGIVWSSNDVLQRTVGRLESLRLQYILLPEVSDIDTESDYKAYLRRKHRNSSSLTTR